MNIDTQSVITYFRDLQSRICAGIADCDGSRDFLADEWQYENGEGGGLTRTLEGGVVIEKGGANFSLIRGETLPAAATKVRPRIAGKPFLATGVSVVMHPLNPFVPTSHMNVRLFVADPDSDSPVWWFGGGYDLTPYYGFVEDCRDWHASAKAACDGFDPECYGHFKKHCDEYFYLAHRGERRGIGGIFFDDLNEPDFGSVFSLVRRVGDSYLDSYKEIVERRKDTAYSESNREFQAYRRGRYVEFNLVYDRGTLFGLQSGGRTESILMSLPPQVAWHYNWQPPADSEEARLTSYFLEPRDWISET